jgi:hypothetical protein
MEVHFSLIDYHSVGQVGELLVESDYSDKAED